ncbi:DUF4349 domain-containing protein [Sphingobacterium suaedae]|uniref:DUF4349 domain-containing protein n=1 Tax=Sphingobacterium suaedae TaxID=1686402 RepID=A0ABW5KJF7_9SPHI
MKRARFSLFTIVALLLSCNRPEKVTEQNASVQEVALDAAKQTDQAFVATSNPPSAEGPNVSAIVPAEKKIIRSGQVALESKNIRSSKSDLDKQLAKFGGYYEQEASTNSGAYLSYTLVARIPAQHFDAFLKAVENGKDQLTSLSIQGEDVSLTYFDTQSRLKSKRVYLVKYQQMVGQAKNVKELLEIQEQIRQLQEEIDSQEVVMRRLKDQIAFSTLRIELFEQEANLPMGTQTFWSQLSQAVHSGWELMKNFILGVIYVWPLWIVIGTSIFLWRRFLKARIRKAKTSRTDTPKG